MASGILTGSITWNFDESTGVLTIGGSGELPERTYSMNLPWNKNDVRKLIFEDGVTAIGKAWFNASLMLTEIVFSDSVTSIGLSSSWMDSNGAFYNCTRLEKITFGTGLTTIHAFAFSQCTALKEIYFYGKQPTFVSATLLNSPCYGQFSLGTSSIPVTATVYSSGWASDSVFTGGEDKTTVRGLYTTFNYVKIAVPSSGPTVPVNVSGTWKESTPYVNVNGTWKEVTAVYVNVNGTWKETV